MTDALMTAFDDGLNALARGEPVSAILARYPSLRGDLRPMLEAASAAHELGAGAPVPPAVQRRSRARFLARAAEQRGSRRAAGALGLAALRAWAVANRAFAVVLAFVLGFTLGTYSVLTASAQSLPGEPLYGLKRTLEQTQLLLSFDERARERLTTGFNEQRVREVERLLAGARLAPVSFGGLLEAVAGERWTVAGITLIVPASTAVDGVPFPGLYVAVEGLSQANGTVVATRVNITGLALLGRVRSLSPAAWQIDQTLVEVNAETMIIGAPGLGDWVKVQARRKPDGAWLALHIALDPLATAAPSPTPVPSRTPTATGPAPSATAPPAATPAPVEVRFTGVVEAQGPQSWQISGQAVLLTAGTEVLNNPRVGQRVVVWALQSASGALTALRLEPEASAPGPTHAPGASSGPGPAPTEPIDTEDEDNDDSGDEASGDDGNNSGGGDNSGGGNNDGDEPGDNPGSGDGGGHSGPSPTHTPDPGEANGAAGPGDENSGDD